MKILMIQMLMGMFFLQTIYAEEMSVESSSVEPIIVEEFAIPPKIQELKIEPLPTPKIQDLVNEVKNAPDNQKRVLINKLKIQLKSMSQENRKKVMLEFKKSFVKDPAKIKDEHKKQQKHESCQQNHQPKFRHLRKGPQDGSGQHGGKGHGKK